MFIDYVVHLPSRGISKVSSIAVAFQRQPAVFITLRKARDFDIVLDMAVR